MEKLFVVLEQVADQPVVLKQAFMNESDALNFANQCGSPEREVWVELYTWTAYKFTRVGPRS